VTAAFTSSLSVPEFQLVREAGFVPLRQVMGSCFQQIGYQWMPQNRGRGGWGTQQAGGIVELEKQTAAWNDGRQLAVERLADEARVAGADAVVGVKLTRGGHDWAGGMIEFILTGTAVRSTRFDLGDEPMLSTLSGQEFAALFTHGFWPVGLVAGSTITYVLAGDNQQWRAGSVFSGLRNQELPDFTRGFYEARELAMARIERQAHAQHAHGIVGLRIDRSSRTYERKQNSAYTDLIITMHLLGTAIVELAHDRPPPPKNIAVDLRRGIR